MTFNPETKMNSLLVYFACTFFMRCSSFVLYTQTGASPILVKEALANSASTSHTSSTRTDTFLFATPPKRIPRRNLKKVRQVIRCRSLFTKEMSAFSLLLTTFQYCIDDSEHDASATESQQFLKRRLHPIRM